MNDLKKLLAKLSHDSWSNLPPERRHALYLNIISLLLLTEDEDQDPIPDEIWMAVTGPERRSLLMHAMLRMSKQSAKKHKDFGYGNNEPLQVEQVTSM